MKRFFSPILLLLALSLICVPSLWTGPAAASGSIPLFSLDDIQKHPDAFLGTSVRLTCQFNDFGQLYNPLYTRFVADQYLNLSVWDDNKNLWVKKDFTKTFPYLYISKNNKQVKDILKLKKFFRFEAVAMIRNNFNKTPWIEIIELKILEEFMTKDDLIRVSNGLKYVKEEQFTKGYKELKVLEGQERIPPRIKGIVYKNMGICAYHTKHYKRAKTLFQKAYLIDPKDKEVEEYLDKALHAEQLLEQHQT